MKHSITNRVIVGKVIGLVAGVLAYFALKYLGVDMSTEFAIGLVIFYAMLGLLTAFIGIYDRHPIFDFKMTRWMRGIVIGLIMHLMLVLLNIETLTYITETMDVRGMTSPYRALLDGVILGLIMSYAETKFAGEGDLPVK